MDWMDDYLGGRSPGTAAGLLHISRMKLSCYRRARSGAHSQRASFVRREIKRFVMRTECAHSAWHRTETARRIKPSKRDKINASSLLSQLHCGSLFFCLPQTPPVRCSFVPSTTSLFLFVAVPTWHARCAKINTPSIFSLARDFAFHTASVHSL